ncbi:MAG: FN3 domain-containing metallophosphoesterase family protein [Planctomycetia bacterium]|nr:FN3 domain-containing metallophosphoesterase family protein [Planctomycetia bacterium]
MSQLTTNRRQFLGVLGATSVALGHGSALCAGEEKGAEPSAPQSVFLSPCVLQNPTENSISVVWLVPAPATGWVEWGTSPDNLDQRATGSVLGLNPYDDLVIAIRIKNLQPNTRYYYRAASALVDFKYAYSIKQREPEYTEVRSFTTPGKNAEAASFSVINDTHEYQDVLAEVLAKVDDLGADYTVWNGDLVHYINQVETIRNAIFHPAGRAFAQENPLLFVRGNHDARGTWVRNLPRFLPTWKHENIQFDALGYNFAVRKGDLALIGLDTGEDKPDFRREWGGLADFEQHIALQREWLEYIMETDAVKTAPFVVAFCHIPLFDANPKANPGTLETGFSAWKKLGADLWGPALKRYNVQLVVAAHTHVFRVDAPTEERPWTQIVGGGCRPEQIPTVIHGVVREGKLHVDAHDVFGKKILASLDFEPRFH